MSMMRLSIEEFADEGDPAYSPIEQMRECVGTRRSARRIRAARIAYMVVTTAIAFVFLFSSLAFGLWITIPLLALYAAWAGFVFGRMPWAKLRQDASEREMWYAMSIPLLQAGAERAKGIEAAILRGIMNSLHETTELAPYDMRNRRRHVSMIADTFQTIHDPQVLAMLAAHVQLACVGLGADIKEESRP